MPRSPVAGYGGFGSAGMLHPQMLLKTAEKATDDSLLITEAHCGLWPPISCVAGAVFTYHLGVYICVIVCTLR